jgi:hypothetical protein
MMLELCRFFIFLNVILVVLQDAVSRIAAVPGKWIGRNVRAVVEGLTLGFNFISFGHASRISMSTARHHRATPTANANFD